MGIWHRALVNEDVARGVGGCLQLSCMMKSVEPLEAKGTTEMQLEYLQWRGWMDGRFVICIGSSV